jgi:hypothetical protein
MLNKFKSEGFLAKKTSTPLQGVLVFWRRHPDLNWGIEVLQTSALPLGYSAIYNLYEYKLLILILYKKCEKLLINFSQSLLSGADYEARTRYLNLGKVALYRMS